MKIEIDLEDLGFRPSEDDFEGGQPNALRQAIVEEAARQTLARFTGEIRGDVMKAVNAAIQEQIAKEVRVAFDTEVQQTSPWGEPQGAKTTVRELIRSKTEAFLDPKVAGMRRDSYDRTPRNLRELVDDVTREVLTRDLKPMVDEARASVKETITKRALQAAAEAIAK